MLDTHNQYEGMHPFPRTVSTGHFEVFWLEYEIDTFHGVTEQGWYWWTCEPGCLPDGEANGPFRTSRQAWKDARNG